MIAARTAATAAAACALLALAACTGPTKIGPTTYITVHPSTRAASTPSPSPVSTAPSASASPTATVAAMTKLPGACDGLLPLGSVVDALGRTVGDATAFVVGVPDPAIDRVSYINCRYGVTKQKKAETAAVEIGVSLYKTPAKAAARLEPTIADYTAHAAEASAAQVAGKPATVLEGGVGEGYGPTVVLAVGQRTIAVSFRQGAVASGQVAKDLTKLAALAAERTSGD
jgi:hypothetical protein